MVTVSWVRSYLYAAAVQSADLEVPYYLYAQMFHKLTPFRWPDTVLTVFIRFLQHFIRHWLLLNATILQDLPLGFDRFLSNYQIPVALYRIRLTFLSIT